ncbi:MAG TPA: LytTR family DNA-binding domain-containing protein [Flavisolibacter sp.]|nr:LytTR family DNA-binding domain-containing protein [Flavisolibacter sp.]
MKIVIIEDEKQAVERFRQVLSDIEEVEVLNVLDTVKSSVRYLQTAPPADLLFMDIQLGDGKSFEILDQVEVKCPIIFITAFDEYAIQAFKYNSIDYLLKPVKKADLEFAIDKYKNALKEKYDYKGLASLLNQFKSEAPEYKSRFLVKKGTRFFSINAADVSHAYTRERVQYIKTFDNSDYMIDSNLDDLEKQLNPADFFRVNRQFIVHHKAVDQALAWFDGKMKLIIQPAAYEDIVISRLRANDFKKWLGK